MLAGKRILVAPLDWGLGHAARCVPIVQRLLARGAVPVIGADGGPAALLRAEFPALEHLRLPGVEVRYARGRSQAWAMARQLPALLRSVHTEQALFTALHRQRRFDAVISDQRFGVRADDAPSVLITHQVFPFTPFAQAALRQLNLRHLARFHACWVMDEPDAPGLAGDLAHGGALPNNARHIGIVSRLRRDAAPPPERFEVVAVISGPEPQRTLLEERLMAQLRQLPGRHLLVLGTPSAAGEGCIGNVVRVPHLKADELAAHLLHARHIVSRSGYTTLMDLAVLGRSALIVPTPGQAEQEYLGRLHARTGRFAVRAQDALHLAADLNAIPPAPAPPPAGAPLLEAALDALDAMIG